MLLCMAKRSSPYCLNSRASLAMPSGTEIVTRASVILGTILFPIIFQVKPNVINMNARGKGY
jgi:hypothetical protein